MGHHPWLNDKNWAVVGASTDPERYGNRIVKKLKANGFNPIPIAPKYDEVEGIKAFPSLLEVEEKIDVVNFVVNPKVGLGVIDQCVELGIDKIWLQPGTVSDELLEKAKDNNIQVEEACILVELTLNFEH